MGSLSIHTTSFHQVFRYFYTPAKYQTNADKKNITSSAEVLNAEHGRMGSFPYVVMTIMSFNERQSPSHHTVTQTPLLFLSCPSSPSFPLSQKQRAENQQRFVSLSIYFPCDPLFWVGSRFLNVSSFTWQVQIFLEAFIISQCWFSVTLSAFNSQ